MNEIEKRVVADVKAIQSTMAHPINKYVPGLCTAWECGVAKGKYEKFGTPLPSGFRDFSAFSFEEQASFDAGFESAMFDRA